MMSMSMSKYMVWWSQSIWCMCRWMLMWVHHQPTTTKLLLLLLITIITWTKLNFYYTCLICTTTSLSCMSTSTTTTHSWSFSMYIVHLSILSISSMVITIANIPWWQMKIIILFTYIFIIFRYSTWIMFNW